MYILVMLRFCLGWLSRTPLLARPIRMFRETVTNRSRSLRGPVRSAVPHEWMSMDYVLTERSGGFAYRGRGTFEKENDPWRSVFRLARRLACGPEPYLAVATVSLGNRPVRRG